ncbi:MAG: hypothetical protein MZW92_00080 [Comamonadaceae bacterium]|nr:hypothetical protein [Comamonadaceae bacterium]
MIPRSFCVSEMGLPVRGPARTARRAGARGQRARRRPARGAAAVPHRQLRAADGRGRASSAALPACRTA